MALWPFTDPPKERPHNSLRTLFIFSAILVPFAAIPYALMRRQHLRIHREVSSLRQANESLAREMRKFAADAQKAQTPSQDVLVTVKEQGNRLRANAVALAEARESLAAARARLDELHGKVDGLGRDVGSEVKGVRQLLDKGLRDRTAMDERIARWREQVWGNVANLAHENGRQRSAFAEDLKETGRSLADVARFVEEVEMREGWTPLPNDGRGIERMRILAKRLEEAAESCEALEEEGHEPEPTFEPKEAKSEPETKSEPQDALTSKPKGRKTRKRK